MELKIEIDETRFSDVIDKELGAFSDDEIHNIITECIKEYLLKDDVIKNLFVHEVKEYSWSNSYRTEATPLLDSIVRKIDLTPTFDEIKKTMTDYFKKESVMDSIIRKAFCDMFLNNFANRILLDTGLRGEIMSEARETVFKTLEENKNR